MNSEYIPEGANKHVDEQIQLFFCRLKDGANTVYHDIYDLERFFESGIRQFICEEEKIFSKGTFILVTSLLHRDHQISGKNDGRMSCQSIIRETMALRDQIQTGLAGLEKYLYLPSFP